MISRVARFEMGDFKLGCAILALAYLISALLVPESLNFWSFPNIACALIFGISAYDVHTRQSIFWKIIPVLLGAYVLIEIVGLAAWLLSGHRHPLGGLVWIPPAAYLVS